MLNLFDNYILFLLVLARMSGAILINPVFGRRNIPSNVKVGMTIMLAIIITASSSAQPPNITNIFEFLIKVFFEFSIGFGISVVMNIFFSAIFIATDLIDIQLGISMSKVFDPGSNVSVPITGSFFNAFLILLFFTTNGHITFFKMLNESVIAIPCGSNVNITGVLYAVPGVLSSALSLALKFAFPIIALEFITEMGMGVLTRTVPNINVFSVGIQLRLIVGFAVLFLISPVFGSFCDQLFSQMYTGIAGAIRLVAVG